MAISAKTSDHVSSKPIVYVIDGDEAVRCSMAKLVSVLQLDFFNHAIAGSHNDIHLRRKITNLAESGNSLTFFHLTHIDNRFPFGQLSAGGNTVNLNPVTPSFA